MIGQYAWLGDARKHKHHWSLREDFHISLGTGGLNFYSDKQTGPYRGSIIGFAEDPNPPQVTARNFPYYYRHIRWRDGTTMRTLTIYLPLVLLPFAVIPLIWLGRELRHSLKRIWGGRRDTGGNSANTTLRTFQSGSAQE
jgi:hypothetical protein